MKYDLLLEKYRDQLLKSLVHLEYSTKKIQSLGANQENLDEEALETREGFMARFARTCDVFLTKYIRTKILIEDPGYNGTFRDHLNQAEKLGLIKNADTWLEIRALRNQQAHEYSDERLSDLFENAYKHAPTLIALKSIL